MNIYLSSCEVGPGSWRHQEEILRRLWKKSSRRHRVVSSPEEADYILIGNIREENWYASLRGNRMISRFPRKCFLLSEADDWQCIPLLRGVYASSRKSMPLTSRYRSGSYGLYHSDFVNPFIAENARPAYLEEKEYLASFSGRTSHLVRSSLFDLNVDETRILIRDNSHFNLFTHKPDGKVENQKKFVELLKKSKFSICPRGAGTSSIRLFESMQIGVAPVIISDDWMFPRGPKWEEFSIVIKESNLGDLENILIENEYRYKEMGKKALEAFGEFFSEEKYFDYIIEQIISIENEQKIPEFFIWKCRNFFVLWRKLKNRFARFYTINSLL